MLFEVTGDRRALDLAVRTADKCVTRLMIYTDVHTTTRSILALRNNPQTGRVMWTGKRELIWPTKEDKARDRLYAGSENMQVVRRLYFLTSLFPYRAHRSRTWSVFRFPSKRWLTLCAGQRRYSHSQESLHPQPRTAIHFGADALFANGDLPRESEGIRQGWR